MPLTKKGNKILSSMSSQYGAKKGKSVFYASINKGKITGAEKKRKTITIPKKEIVEEHKELVQKLKHGGRPALKKEAAKQAKELKGYEKARKRTYDPKKYTNGTDLLGDRGNKTTRNRGLVGMYQAATKGFQNVGANIAKNIQAGQSGLRDKSGKPGSNYYGSINPLKGSVSALKSAFTAKRKLLRGMRGYKK